MYFAVNTLADFRTQSKLLPNVCEHISQILFHHKIGQHAITVWQSCCG